MNSYGTVITIAEALEYGDVLDSHDGLKHTVVEVDHDDNTQIVTVTVERRITFAGSRPEDSYHTSFGYEETINLVIT